MYTIKQLLQRVMFDLVLACLGGLLLGTILYDAEMDVTLGRQQENFAIKLDIAKQKVEACKQEATDELSSYDQFNEAKADVLAYFYDCNPDKMNTLDKMAEQWQLKEIYIVDASGKVLYQNSNGDEDTLKQNDVVDTLSSRVGVDVNNIRYYTSEMKNKKQLIIGRNSTEFFKGQAERISMEHALKNIRVGNTGVVVAVDTVTGEMSYSGGKKIEGKTAKSVGITDDVLKGKACRWITYNGQNYYGQASAYNDKYTFIALASHDEIYGRFQKMYILSMIIYFVIAFLILFYIHFIRVEEIRRRLDDDIDIEYMEVLHFFRIDKGIVNKVVHILSIGLILTLGISLYGQTLTQLSSQKVRSDTKLSDIERIIDENDQLYQDVKAQYNEEYSRRMENLAYLLSIDPTMGEDKSLEVLAKRAQIKSLYVFNEKGEVIATNTVYRDFVLSKKEGEQSYEFWDVVRGYKDVVCQEATEDETAEHGMVQYIGAKLVDKPGMLQGGMQPQHLNDRLEKTKITNILGNIAVENQGMALAVDAKTKNIAYYQDETYMDRPVMDYGLTESALTDGYTGYQTFHGTNYFTSGRLLGKYYIFISAPDEYIMSGRIKLSVIITVVSALVFILLGLFAILERKSRKIHVSKEAKEKYQDRKVQVEIQQNDGTKRMVQTAKSRWEHKKHIPWFERTPEQKLKTVFFGIVAILGVLLFLYLYQMKDGYDSLNILSYIVHKKWEKTPSIFSISYILMVLLEAIVITTVIRRLISFIAENLGNRMETIARLLNNFIKYAVVFGVILYCMNYVGVNSAAVLASAGIFTLVIGLGAQSLISDILAGIFIVFEGEFQVGDIVTIGDWRGTVLEIGIRATKIEDINQNIKIISNSSISGVVNMTKQRSYAGIDVGIEYGESLERIESILDKELPLVKERIPEIVEGPFYKGVTALADSSVIIKIVAECQEVDRVPLGRSLNREVKLIFDKYNINIPFPQVVVNEREKTEPVRATQEEKEEAKRFVEAQKTASRNITADEEDN